MLPVSDHKDLESQTWKTWANPETLQLKVQYCSRKKCRNVTDN